MVALVSAALAVPILATNASVTGSLTTPEGVTLTPQAVAIVTIVDQTAAPEAGVVIGQQRIDGPTAAPIDFSVLYDDTTIDPTHSYALFASIVDGSSTWENAVGEPVITGGPTDGINLVLTALPTPAATIGGTILPPAGTALSPSAVAIAALVKVETGTLVARQVVPVADPANVAFSIGFDPSLIDPAATYVVKGGIVDGATVWQNREGVSAIAAGKAIATVELPVTQAPTGVPVASIAPPPTASPTAAPTATPTPTPTATPTASPDIRSDRDADSDPDANADADPNADANPDPDADANTDPHARRRPPTPTPTPTPDRDADAGPVGRPDTIADHRPRDRDADLPRATHADR